MQEKEIIDQGMALNIIHKLQVFKHFTLEEKQALAKQQNYFAVYNRDEELIREDDTDDSFFVLVSGTVRVMKKNCSLQIAELEPGEIFGEISFLTSRPRTASVMAKEDDVIALKMNKQIIDDLDSTIREKLKDLIIEKLIERLDRMNNTLARFA